jgi:UDP-N-acetyl-D-mannosaminuronic acid dehydrogenase
LPNFIVSQLRQKQKLREKVVAVLGMAFKSESDDKRESLSYRLRKLLMVEAKEVLCTDPYVVDEKLVPLDVVLERSDIIILGAPHSVYRDLRFSADQVCVDVWGFWPETRQSAPKWRAASFV